MYTGVRHPDPPVRILVVRLGAMGDIIHALPAVASLKHSIPGSRITWVVEPQWEALLEGNPHVDERIRFDRDSAAALLRARRDLQREPFDFAVDFQGLLKSALVATASNAARLYGFDRSQVRETAAAIFYTNRTFSAASHVVDRNLDLARAAGAMNPLVAFPIPAGEPEQPLPEGDFILACPMAGWGSKQWPLESYTQLAKRLKMPLVVNGPAWDSGKLDQIDGAHRHVSGLPGLIYATRRATAVIGVDSGPMHLAAALQKPGVAIFGPTDPERNGPYGNSLRVLRSPDAATSYKRRSETDESMRAITPDEVLAALEAQLQPA